MTDCEKQDCAENRPCFEGWQPMSTAPKDRPIVVCHRHGSDPYHEPEPSDRLTPYGTYVEVFGTHLEDGPFTAEWVKGDVDWDEYSGKTIRWPDWWFAFGSDGETPLAPVGWAPIPRDAPDLPTRYG